jgi:hypothetical protein
MEIAIRGAWAFGSLGCVSLSRFRGLLRWPTPHPTWHTHGCHGRLSSTPDGDLNEAPQLGYRDGADFDAIRAVARSPGSRGPRSPARGGAAEGILRSLPWGHLISASVLCE